MRSERRAPDTEQGNTRRVLINFASSTYGILEEIATQNGTSISAVIHDAIALKKWWVDVHQEGGRVLVDRGGSIHEVSRV